MLSIFPFVKDKFLQGIFGFPKFLFYFPIYQLKNFVSDSYKLLQKNDSTEQ